MPIFIKSSPINAVDQLSCPVIFFQGLEDSIVPRNQAEEIVEALRKEGLPVAYVAGGIAQLATPHPVPTVLQGVSDKRARGGELAVSMSVTPAAHRSDGVEASGTVFSRYATHGHTSPFR